MDGILFPLRSYRELTTRTRLTTTALCENLVISDWGVLKFPVELWDQDVQNSTSQHNDDDKGKTHFPETGKNVRSCERETKIEERDQLHLYRIRIFTALHLRVKHSRYVYLLRSIYKETNKESLEKELVSAMRRWKIE